jgi:hypothetical protein
VELGDKQGGKADIEKAAELYQKIGDTEGYSKMKQVAEAIGQM